MREGSVIRPFTALSNTGWAAIFDGHKVHRLERTWTRLQGVTYAEETKFMMITPDRSYQAYSAADPDKYQTLAQVLTVVGPHNIHLEY